MHQYARYVDGGNAARIAELFTDDGKWIGADGGTMDGKAEILRAFTGRQGLTRRQSRHVITNQLVDVIDDDNATGIAYLINYRHDSKTGVAEHPAPGETPKFVGDYHLEYKRVDGEWKVHNLRFDLVFLRRRDQG